MVLEAVGGFALACNILQVVEYGAKIVSKARNLHLDQERGEIYDLDKTTQQLSRLNKDFGDFVASSSTMYPAQIRLMECNNECLRLSQNFISFVAKLQPRTANPSDKLSRTKALCSAIRMKWHQDEIVAMQKNLSQAKSNLMIAFLLHRHSKSTDTTLKPANRSEENVLSAIDSTSNKLHDEITRLKQQMSNLRVDEPTDCALLNTFQTSHADQISLLISRVENVSLQNIESAQNRICMSLSFVDMDSRRNQIREADEETYDWILNPLSAAGSGFQEWLDASEPTHWLFWISGKPGSGKSTLMQYLDINLSESCCGTWLKGQNLFICKFFLWHPGRRLQKSFEGLLRAILHRCLSANRWAVQLVVGEDKWSMAQSTDLNIEWTVPDLKRITKTCFEQIPMTGKVLLLLDGLDELDGNDDDREDMLKFLRSLSQVQHVKLCVSSRPWNIFKDFFNEYPVLQLHEYTRKDIEKYVRNSISPETQLQNAFLHNSGEAKKLIGGIVDKANGVFLWVHLVIKELLRGFRDGETIRTLRRKVDAMPADLNGFFKRMIDTIDPAYRREGSAFLQTALFSLQDHNIEWPRGLLEFTFLEADDPDFALSPDYDFTELDLIDIDALEYRIDLGKRRINSRCMGLLESVYDPKKSNLNSRDSQALDTEVVFLHRSLMDFLLTTDAQDTLQQLTNGPFRVRNFLCCALLAKIVALTTKCSRECDIGKLHDPAMSSLLYGSIDWLLRALASPEDIDSAAVDIIMRRLETVFDALRRFQSLNWVALDDSKLFKLISSLGEHENLPIRVAIEYRISAFMQNNRTRETIDLHSPYSRNRFLFYALLPITDDPDLEIVSCLLKADINPNGKVYHEYIWEKFFRMLPDENSEFVVSWDQVKILEMLVKNHASLDAPGKLGRIWTPEGRNPQSVTLIEFLEHLNMTRSQLNYLKSRFRESEDVTVVNSQNGVPTDIFSTTNGKRRHDETHTDKHNKKILKISPE